MATDDNPIETWLIELQGRAADLLEWKGVFKDYSLATVITAPGRDGEPTYFVASERLDGLKDTEVYRQMADLLQMMNGVAKVHSDNVAPVNEAWLWYQLSDGTRVPLTLVDYRGPVPIETLTGVSARALAGSFGPPQQTTALALLARYPLIAEALAHFAEPDNWFDFWKAYEVVEYDIGGGDKGARGKLKARKWVAASEFDAFCATCNHHRHSRASKKHAPSALMTRTDARRVLSQLLRAWISEKRDAIVKR